MTESCELNPAPKAGNTLPLEVRAVRAGDFETITSIYGYHVEHGTGSFETVPPDAAEMAARGRGVLEWGGVYLVAARGSDVAGFAYVGPFNRRQAYQHTAEVSVYICPHELHSGIGSLLMRELIEKARAKGFRQLVSLVGDSENKASIGLHEKFGFVRQGVLRDVGIKFGRSLDVVFMQKTL